MGFADLLPILLGAAWLAPLASFALIVFFGPWMGRAGKGAGYLATGAIMLSFVLSAIALGTWLFHHPVTSSQGAEAGIAEPLSGDWYELGRFGSLVISVGYYIDALTIGMFAMVTLVASCIHVYSFGYMHEELEEVTDPLVTSSDGQPLKRRGRFHRFYQYFSLFCFSMLGLVIAGNLAMVFVFWELVGICSYLLIGFYRERKSASNAANKAFIVNRVGDFGMLIGMMALWAGLGTFSFGDYTLTDDGVEKPGIFTQVRPAGEDYRRFGFSETRPAEEDYALFVPDGMVKLAARSEVEKIVRTSPDIEEAKDRVQQSLPVWRDGEHGRWAYWLLVIGGIGIFCGCVGKSAQFPLHVWLPDAMEGPTPVSALIHAATMVAAGVYLVGRFFPVFTPEVLLVIAVVGAITLFLAATIAITATDIKRVLAYSTVSQLGYMMLGLGVGGWVAGLFHLLTHAFFKALLFLGSGSVIHACHTNEMPRMGGLRKKMPWTAYTMLVGCLAIAGAGIPTVIGLSGYYSKDSILLQAFSFKHANPSLGWIFFWVAAMGAVITAFYMFRMWFLTFAGKPRDEHVYAHAHESPKTMYVPLVVLAGLAVIAGWTVPFTELKLPTLLEQARPEAAAAGAAGGRLLPEVTVPEEPSYHAHAAEEAAHAAESADAHEGYDAHGAHVTVSWIAFLAAATGFAVALVFYGIRKLNPETARKSLAPAYVLLKNKWWFDELYRAVFVRPALWISRCCAEFDRRVIDWLADNLARWGVALSRLDDVLDRWLVDGLVNQTAAWTHRCGLWLRSVQTGNLRQYVMLIALGTVVLFMLISLY
ncbi:MAG: NADH-quinone oxidoreductase subunit 5 family protein [Planctomycetota bacterium]|jgi:NADH-quinone oxidoreductase subunit L